MASTDASLLHCDGCGQPASPEHLARRLRRLEWATRYRPLHIQALLLGSISPLDDVDFLYSPERCFQGEAGQVLEAVQLPTEGRPVDAVLTEFQKRGLMLTHVLQCPAEPGLSDAQVALLLQDRLAATIARLRRSFKPKRIILISAGLLPLLAALQHADLGCPVFPASSPFFLEGSAGAIDLHSTQQAESRSDGA